MTTSAKECLGLDTLPHVYVMLLVVCVCLVWYVFGFVVDCCEIRRV